MKHSRVGTLVGAAVLLVAVSASSQGAVFRYSGTVVGALGTAPVLPGAACAISVQQVASGQYNCRIQIECGGVMIFGAGNAGYEVCGFNSVETGVIFHGSATSIAARDNRPSFIDGDPDLNLNLPAGPVIVSDGTDAAHVWSVRVGQTRER